MSKSFYLHCFSFRICNKMQQKYVELEWKHKVKELNIHKQSATE